MCIQPTSPTNKPSTIAASTPSTTQIHRRPQLKSSDYKPSQFTITLISSWMSFNYLTLNPSKTEFILISLHQQTCQIVNPSLSLPTTKLIIPSLSAKNLGFIFNSTLSFSKQISSLSSACPYHIRDLRRIRHTLDSTTATTIATALVQSRLDYCNSLYHGLPSTQIKRLHHIQNGLARAVIRTFKHSHISPVLKSLHWLKVEQRIQYKIISITHNLFYITEPKYLHRLINIKPPSRTRFSDHLCLSLPPVSTRLKFADRSFRNSSPRLWNSSPQPSALLLPSLAEHSLFLAMSFFSALKLTSSLFPILHKFPALPFLPAPFPIGQF